MPATSAGYVAVGFTGKADSMVPASAIVAFWACGSTKAAADCQGVRDWKLTAAAKGVVSAAKDVFSAASVGVTTSAKAEAKVKGVASARFEVEHELAVAE